MPNERMPWPMEGLQPGIPIIFPVRPGRYAIQRSTVPPFTIPWNTSGSPLGSLDDPTATTLAVNVYCESMLPWVKDISGLSCFEKEFQR